MNGLKSRVIYRVHSDQNTSWAGDYNLLAKFKEITSPFGDPNTYDASTLEDLVEINETGRSTANDLTLESPWTLEDLTRLTGLEQDNQGNKILYDIVFLYGNGGTGNAGKLAFTAELLTTPGDANDEHLVLNTTITVKSTPVWQNSLTATVTEDASGNVTAVALA